MTGCGGGAGGWSRSAATAASRLRPTRQRSQHRRLGRRRPRHGLRPDVVVRLAAAYLAAVQAGAPSPRRRAGSWPIRLHAAARCRLAVIGLIQAAHRRRPRRLNNVGLVLHRPRACIGAVFYLIQQTIDGAGSATRSPATLRRDMYDHLRSSRCRFYDEMEVGRMMSRLTSDVRSLQDLLTSGFLTIIGDFVGIGIVVVILLYLDWQLALVTFAVVPLARLDDGWSGRATRARAFIDVRQAIAVVNGNLQENVSGVRVIQTCRVRTRTAKRFDKLNQREPRRQHLRRPPQRGRHAGDRDHRRHRDRRSSSSTAATASCNGDDVESPALDRLHALRCSCFFDPIRDLVLQYTQFQRAMAGGERMFEVLDTQPESRTRRTPSSSTRSRAASTSTTSTSTTSRRAGAPGHRPARRSPARHRLRRPDRRRQDHDHLAGLPRCYEVTGGAIRDRRPSTSAKSRRRSLTRHMGVVLQEPFLFTGTVAREHRLRPARATDAE